MIVLDTTVLANAVGGDHPLASPCRRLVEAIGEGRVDATTTVEAIQEFVHVRARRRARRDAANLGRSYAELLAPLLTVSAGALERGLRLFERHPALGAFDAVLAAPPWRRGPRRPSPADRAFSSVPGLPWVDPGGPGLQRLLNPLD